jgi:hypothetical protein
MNIKINSAEAVRLALPNALITESEIVVDSGPYFKADAHGLSMDGILEPAELTALAYWWTHKAEFSVESDAERANSPIRCPDDVREAFPASARITSTEFVVDERWCSPDLGEHNVHVKGDPDSLIVDCRLSLRQLQALKYWWGNLSEFGPITSSRPKLPVLRAPGVRRVFAPHAEITSLGLFSEDDTSYFNGSTEKVIIDARVYEKQVLALVYWLTHLEEFEPAPNS